MKNARHPDYAGIKPACAAGSLKYSLDTTANRSANTIFGFTERLKPLAETFANGES
jgi:hypothetical protein